VKRYYIYIHRTFTELRGCFTSRNR